MPSIKGCLAVITATTEMRKCINSSTNLSSVLPLTGNNLSYFSRVTAAPDFFAKYLEFLYYYIHNSVDFNDRKPDQIRALEESISRNMEL